MKLVFAVVALSLPVTAGVAQAPATYEVLPEATMHPSANGLYCVVDLTMKNDLVEAIEISGKAILVDDEGTTLGQRLVDFPSAMPKGKAKTDALFSNGPCQTSTVYLDVDTCRFTGTDTGLKDVHCKRRFTFSFKMN